MERLIYLSKAVEQFDELALADLAEQAALMNAKCGVTGFLTHSEGTFLQCLEGEPAAVETIWQRVATDPRHAVTKVCRYRTSDARIFPDWHMRLLPAMPEHGDRYAILDRTFKAMCAPIAGDIHGLLEELLREIAATYLTP